MHAERFVGSVHVNNFDDIDDCDDRKCYNKFIVAFIITPACLMCI